MFHCNFCFWSVLCGFFCVNHASMQMGLETPDVLAINCTNLANTSEIFGKVLSASQL